MRYQAFLIPLLLTFSACSLIKSGSPEAQLARCINDKGIILYGTTWGSNTSRQLQAFGDASKYLNFIDCQKNKNACSRANIKENPTWFFPEGNIERSGFLRLDMLASFASCPYSQKVKQKSN